MVVRAHREAGPAADRGPGAAAGAEHLEAVEAQRAGRRAAARGEADPAGGDGQRDRDDAAGAGVGVVDGAPGLAVPGDVEVERRRVAGLDLEAGGVAAGGAGVEGRVAGLGLEGEHHRVDGAGSLQVDDDPLAVTLARAPAGPADAGLGEAVDGELGRGGGVGGGGHLHRPEEREVARGAAGRGRRRRGAAGRGRRRPGQDGREPEPGQQPGPGSQDVPPGHGGHLRSGAPLLRHADSVLEEQPGRGLTTLPGSFRRGRPQRQEDKGDKNSEE